MPDPTAGAGAPSKEATAGERLADVLDKPQRPEERGAGFKLAAFGAVLVVVLFAGYGIGRLNEATPTAATGAAATDQGAAATTGDTHAHGGGTAPAPAQSHDDTGTAPHVHNADGSITPAGGSSNGGSTGSGATGGAATGGGAGAVGGLTVTSDGLTMVPKSATFVAGKGQRFSFAIRAAGQAPVTTFAVVHDKPLHLIVVRRDLSGFQHLHPTMTPDGTWGVPLTLAAPGSYRAIADFTAIVGGQQVPATLGVDLTVPGDYRPVALPAPVRQATTDGFKVSYEGTPKIGSAQPLFMTVTTATGAPATLEPYLGAFGHLVVMREGDLGYVHVHPEPQLVEGKVKFWLAAPGPGRYRMFFDFQVAGQVHTAAWTAEIS